MRSEPDSSNYRTIICHCCLTNTESGGFSSLFKSRILKKYKFFTGLVNLSDLIRFV